MTIRVLIVDDHPIFRDGLQAALDGADGIDVVGEAADGPTALAAAAALRPDVILMDLNLPGMSGIEATRAVLGRQTEVKVLVLTMQADDESVFAAVRAGASGYLLKGADRQELIRSVQGVAAGEAVFGSAVAARILGHFSRTPVAAPFPQLTDREREILDLVAAGLGNQAIAARLCLAPKTIRNNVAAILQKLQAADRAEAIARARGQGLGQDPAPGLGL